MSNIPKIGFLLTRYFRTPVGKTVVLRTRGQLYEVSAVDVHEEQIPLLRFAMDRRGKSQRQAVGRKGRIVVMSVGPTAELPIGLSLHVMEPYIRFVALLEGSLLLLSEDPQKRSENPILIHYIFPKP